MDVLNTLTSCINARWQRQEAPKACQEEKEGREHTLKSIKIGYHPLNTRRWWNNWQEGLFSWTKIDLRISSAHTYANIHWHSLLLLFAKADHCKKGGTFHSHPQRYCACNCKKAFHIHSWHTHLHGRYTYICKTRTDFRQTVHFVPQRSPNLLHRPTHIPKRRDSQDLDVLPKREETMQQWKLIKIKNEVALFIG